MGVHSGAHPQGWPGGWASIAIDGPASQPKNQMRGDFSYFAALTRRCWPMIWPVWVLPCPLLLATTLRRAPLHPLFCPLRAAEQEGGGGFTRRQLAEAAGLLVRSRVRRERNVAGRLCLHEGLGNSFSPSSIAVV